MAVLNHSSKDINNTATEVEEEVLRRDAADTQVNRPVREINMEQKARLKWPRANSNKEWEAVNKDSAVMFGRLGGNASDRLEKMGDIFYSYGVESFWVQDRKRVERVHLVKSRWQREMEKLVKERRNLRKQWKRATEEDREGINVLQEELRSRLAILRRDEYLRKKRKKKGYVRTAFYRYLFKFVKVLFNQEKGGQLKATKSEVEEYLRNTYSDLEQCRVVGLPPDMPPLGEMAHKMEVEEVCKGFVGRRAEWSPLPGL